MPLDGGAYPMDDIETELNSAILQARKHYVEHAKHETHPKDVQLRRYLYAVTAVANDRFLSLHSGRRSRSLTRVYLEERKERSKSAHGDYSVPVKKSFLDKELQGNLLRLHFHETFEGNVTDAIQADSEEVHELERELPQTHQDWEHETALLEEPDGSKTIWRIGDHLFSFIEPRDLDVELPAKLHYFFTGELLSSEKLYYRSLPSLVDKELYASSMIRHKSMGNLYGHGFRRIGNQQLSRDMKFAEERSEIGLRKSLDSIIHETKHDAADVVAHAGSQIPTISPAREIETAPLHHHVTQSRTTEIVRDSTYHAFPDVTYRAEPIFLGSDASDCTTVIHASPPPQDTLYADAPQETSVVHADESLVVHPPSPSVVSSATKFADDFVSKIDYVDALLKESEAYQKQAKEKKEHIYDDVYERHYDSVPRETEEQLYSDYAEIPVTQPQRPDELHYAAVAVATDDLYKDDENIYEEIQDNHVIESSTYATKTSAKENLYEQPRDRSSERIYEEIRTPLTPSGQGIAEIKEKFEKAAEVEHPGRINAPKRKDFEGHIYDAPVDVNYNLTVDTLEAPATRYSRSSTSESLGSRVGREVKPYLASPTFNRLQKEFFPEDHAERIAQRESREEFLELNSPTAVISDAGVEYEKRAYDKNVYEDVVTDSSATDEVEAARATVRIRRMSKNNQWSEDEFEAPTRIKSMDLESIIPPNSPFVKLGSGASSPRLVSPQPPRSRSAEPEKRTPSPLDLTAAKRLDEQRYSFLSTPTPGSGAVPRVVSSQEKAEDVPEFNYKKGFVAEKRKLFEKYDQKLVQPQQPVIKRGKRPGTPVRPMPEDSRTPRGSMGNLSLINGGAVKEKATVHEPAETPAEHELKRMSELSRSTELEHSTPPAPDSPMLQKRRSVHELAREYEQTHFNTPTPALGRGTSVASSRATSTTSITQSVTTTAKRSECAEDKSSEARRTVQRTLRTLVASENDNTRPSSLGNGAIPSKIPSPSSQQSPITPPRNISTSSELYNSKPIPYGTAGTASKVPPPRNLTPITPPRSISASPSPRHSPQPSWIPRRSPSPTEHRVSPVAAPETHPPAKVAVANGAVPQPPPADLICFDEVAPEPERRESNKENESDEPVELQRNGSGRRSWPVKTYENTVRLDNKKLKIKMPDFEYLGNGHIPNGVEKMDGEEHEFLREWDPRALISALYSISYEPRLETKRNRFLNMEGHVEVPSDETNTLAELEREWRQQYMRTKEGRLQYFVTHCAEEAPATEIVLSGADVDANREERTLTIHGGKEKLKLVLRVPSNVFDKWRQALLSHTASSEIDAFVKPVARSLEHLSERVVVFELGTCSIRGGVITQEPSLPQSFFPAIAVKTEDGRIVVGADAYAPDVRHSGEFVRPIQASDPALERYTMDKDVVKACLVKVVEDLRIDPRKYKVLLSISQNIPTVLISELVSIAINDIHFQGAAVTRQPSLILYAYDVTTGVVVDIGDRLNIVPVIDGYVVDSAICSMPYGATQMREALKNNLHANNKTPYWFQSPVEKLILRYAMEQNSYVPEDYANEHVKDVEVSLEPFNPTKRMWSKFSIDSSRFTCTEGLFHPKKWGLDTKGLHQLIHEAVQMSPIDSRRILYRNIYLAGGASLLPGLAEKLEQELANIVPNTVHTQVHISPWRYNAAYLGAQVVASSSTFEDQCVTAKTLPKYLQQLASSSF